MTVKRILFVVVVTAMAVAGFTYFLRGNAENVTSDAPSHAHEEDEDYQNILLTERQVRSVDLSMAQVQNREINTTIPVTGSLVLRAQSTGDVTSLMGGVVRSILVREGQTVRKGQVVATIENTEVVSLQREYFSASKECQMALTEMERQETLSQGGAGIKKTLQQTRKAYQVAQATLVGIGRQLTQLGIRPAEVAKGRFTTVFPLCAPVSGTVSQLTASLGSYADMQTPLMRIRDNSAVECDLNVFERDLNKVSAGDRVSLTLTNQTGVTLTGHVYGMNGYFNEGTKSVAVHVRLDNIRGKKLLDGMYVSGTIATGRKSCKALPSRAIVKADGKDYIFALNGAPKDGKYSFSRHEVTTGATENGYAEVTLCEHIRDGQKIVSDNAFYLASLTGEHGEHNH